MKRLVLCLAVALCGGLFTTAIDAHAAPIQDTMASEDFARGWDGGYVAGWRHVKGPNAIAPIPPIPPIAPIGRNNYQGGYGLGFVEGMNDAR